MRKNKSRKNMKGGLFGFFENKYEADNRPSKDILNDFKQNCTTDPAQMQADLNKSPQCPALKANYSIAANKENAMSKSVAGENSTVVMNPQAVARTNEAAKPWYKIWGGRSRRNRSRKSRRNRKSRKSRK